jgi:sulfur-carrier protein
MKSIKVSYFASLRECSGKENETLDVECETYRDLYQQLAKGYGFALPVEAIQVAVNDKFAPLNSSVEDGAKVVFIPPVAGG